MSVSGLQRAEYPQILPLICQKNTSYISSSAEFTVKSRTLNRTFAGATTANSLPAERGVAHYYECSTFIVGKHEHDADGAT